MILGLLVARNQVSFVMRSGPFGDFSVGNRYTLGDIHLGAQHLWCQTPLGIINNNNSGLGLVS